MMNHDQSSKALSASFDLVVIIAGLAVIILGFIISDDSGFLVIVAGIALTGAGVVVTVLSRVILEDRAFSR